MVGGRVLKGTVLSFPPKKYTLSITSFYVMMMVMVAVMITPKKASFTFVRLNSHLLSNSFG